MLSYILCDYMYTWLLILTSVAFDKFGEYL